MKMSASQGQPLKGELPLLGLRSEDEEPSRQHACLDSANRLKANDRLDKRFKNPVKLRATHGHTQMYTHVRVFHTVGACYTCCHSLNENNNRTAEIRFHESRCFIIANDDTLPGFKMMRLGPQVFTPPRNTTCYNI
ncbi:hypothetical protein JOB18_009183 [Solea senegalensis]|uniref:Uncharacterized protein n=1 Tax=Solea senegalensis TaxID=28829 RepID=A0AAV6T4Q3_SOLSE|nr:hypothetical protein JOB18_009183 [Solea senegalensis]